MAERRSDAILTVINTMKKTYSGSTSPSQTIQHRCSKGSFTTRRAAAVSTPSDHSRVSRFIEPSNCRQDESSACMNMMLGSVCKGFRIVAEEQCSVRIMPCLKSFMGALLSGGNAAKEGKHANQH
eukprot:1136764-Pelagomonas_calceolata.AAC.2